jgi:hypothetical protein
MYAPDPDDESLARLAAGAPAITSSSADLNLNVLKNSYSRVYL